MYPCYGHSGDAEALSPGPFLPAAALAEWTAIFRMSFTGQRYPVSIGPAISVFPTPRSAASTASSWKTTVWASIWLKDQMPSERAYPACWARCRPRRQWSGLTIVRIVAERIGLPVAFNEPSRGY